MLSLYRKYRPETFADLVGQEHVRQTLTKAVVSGSFAHAYLFTGPRGTGKTTTARLLAKALLCVQAPTATPDGTCEDCRLIAESRHPDVYELDAASRTGVDNVREEITDRVAFAPTRGKYKFYIIDEVHMLSTSAFNALLKTIEEPPAHVIFVLCTTDVQKVPATVISRTQRFDFHKFSNEQIVARLRYICDKEGFSAEPLALELIAEWSAGGMRDAIGELEQVATYGDGKISGQVVSELLGANYRQLAGDLVDQLLTSDVAGQLQWLDQFVLKGFDLGELAQALMVYLRNLYLSRVAGNNPKQQALIEGGVSEVKRYAEQASRLASSDWVVDLLRAAFELAHELKETTDQRLAFEVFLITQSSSAGTVASPGPAAPPLSTAPVVPSSTSKPVVSPSLRAEVQTGPQHKNPKPGLSSPKSKLDDIVARMTGQAASDRLASDQAAVPVPSSAPAQAARRPERAESDASKSEQAKPRQAEQAGAGRSASPTPAPAQDQPERAPAQVSQESTEPADLDIDFSAIINQGLANAAASEE
ncbi:MAG: DNA polymerase III subunit gamma/tau [Coriobacteriales bacterium]|jgi:DNA polymerase-3 subunit gamma/tau|nr:DNA polymerase III subunit gamma/tau [Coriobacteriales bacterium]